jgi:hypothetical protein
MLQPNDNERMPYWFSEAQVDLLARTIGQHRENDNSLALKSINDEIGVALTRRKISPVRQKLAVLFSKTPIALHLSELECHEILRLNPSDEIVKVIKDGI